MTGGLGHSGLHHGHIHHMDVDIAGVEDHDFLFAHLDPDHVSELPLDARGSDDYQLGTGGIVMLDMADRHAQYRRDSLSSASLMSPLSAPLSLTKFDSRSPADAAQLVTRRTSFASTNPFRDANAAGMNASMLSASAPSAGGWRFGHVLDTASPLSLDPLAVPGDDFDMNDTTNRISPADSLALQSPSDQGPFTQMADFRTPRQSIDQTHGMGPSASGRSASMATISDLNKNNLPTPVRPARPARPVVTRAASDGIRKKNARIDIPAERNLGNIEELINQATNDDDTVKELKMQRRLLRNREAALASRQRKKAHTEELEVKEQNYMRQIQDLSAQVQFYRQYEAECAILNQKLAEMTHLVNGCEMEKEELIARHTDETASLRRRLQYLTDRSNTSNDYDAFQPNNLTDFTSNMKALTVDGQHWAVNGQHRGDVAPVPPGFTLASQGPRQVAAPRPHQKQPSSASEQPVASGMLFTILLCGAYVASKAQNSDLLPRMPDEVRAASTSILHNLLEEPMAESGALPAGGGHGAPNVDFNPQGHAFAQQFPTSTQPASSHSIFRSMSIPTSQQEMDQAFHLTSGDYQMFTTPGEYAMHQPQTTSVPSRALGTTIIGLRQRSIDNVPVAHMYSRSLLWDEIPMQLVKEFKDLVINGKEKDGTGQHEDTTSMTKHEYHDGKDWAY